MIAARCDIEPMPLPHDPVGVFLLLRRPDKLPV